MNLAKRMVKGSKTADQGNDQPEDVEVNDVVSIVGPGMTIRGDCSTEGTLRVEGRVEGTVRASKAVVVGAEGEVVGDIETQDAVVAGRVEGSIQAESRVELEESCHVEGDIRSRRVKLEEGGTVQGCLEMGKETSGAAAKPGRGEGPPELPKKPDPSGKRSSSPQNSPQESP